MKIKVHSISIYGTARDEFELASAKADFYVDTAGLGLQGSLRLTQGELSALREVLDSISSRVVSRISV